MVTQFHGDAHAVPQPPAVKLFLEVVVIEVRLIVRVGGLESQFAGAHGQVDGDRRPDAQRFHAVPAPDHLLGGEGREDHDHVVAQIGPFSGVLQARLDAGRKSIKVEAGPGAPGYGNDGMVTEVLADAGAIVHHRDAKAPQMVGRDPRRRA